MQLPNWKRWKKFWNFRSRLNYSNSTTATTFPAPPFTAEDFLPAVLRWLLMRSSQLHKITATGNCSITA